MTFLNNRGAIMYFQVHFREDFLPDPYSPNLVFKVNIASSEDGILNSRFNGQHGVLDPRQASRQAQSKVIKFHSGNIHTQEAEGQTISNLRRFQLS